jgi:hypothetical protein
MTREEFKELIAKEFFESRFQLIDLEDGGVKLQYKMIRDIEEEYFGSKRSGLAASYSEEAVRYSDPLTIRYNSVLIMIAQFSHLVDKLTKESEELLVIVEEKRAKMQENLECYVTSKIKE